MKQKSLSLIIILAAAILLTASAGRAQTLTATATLDTDTVTTGEAVQMSITVEGSTLAEQPAIPNIDGLQISYLGPSTQVQIINGKYFAVISHNYEIVALKPGSYTLGPFEVKVKNDKLVANAVTLQVNGATAQPKSAAPAGDTSSPLGDKLFMEMELGKSKLFLGEKTPLKIRVYFSEIAIDEISYPVINQPEFVLDQMNKPSQRKTVINGRSYQVVEFSTNLSPVQTGKFVLGPARLNCTVLIKAKTRDPFLADFFSDYKKYPFELKSNRLNLNVMPLPENGKPANFSGCIGRFQVQVSGQPSEVLQGEPVTIRLTVTGNGNLQMVKPPLLTNTQGMKVYDAQKKNPAGKGETGQVQFEQVVIPIDPKVKQIGPFQFAYFDPYQGSYRQITTAVIPINVKPNPNFKAALFDDTNDSEASGENLGKDLIYIKDRPGDLKRREEQLIYRTWFWLIQLIPVLAIFAAAGYRRRRKMLHADTPRSRALRASGRAAKLMAQVKSELAKDKPERVLEVLHLVIREYLGEKYNLNIAGMTGSVVDQISQYGVPPETLKEIREFFEKYDYYRFTGSKIGLVEARQLWEEINGIIKTLDGLGNSRPKTGKGPERREYNGKF